MTSPLSPPLSPPTSLFSSLSLSPSPSLPSLLLHSSTTYLTSALSSLPSGILLVSPDSPSLYHLLHTCIPTYTFHACTSPHPPPNPASGCLVLADVDLPLKKVETTIKGVFARRGKGLVVIGLARDESSVNGGMIRGGRFEKVIRVGIGEGERRQCWKSVLKRGNVEEFVKRSVGYGLREFGLVIGEGMLGGEMETAMRGIQGSEDGDLDFMVGSGGVVGDEGWGRVGGYEETKGILERAVEWPVRYGDGFRRLGVGSTRGVLLFGEGGCGKSLLAESFVRGLKGVNWLHVRGGDLYSRYLGESEERVRKMFRKARQLTPCVIFVDDLEIVGGIRGREDGGSGVEGRVVAAFLSEMDGIEGGGVCVLGCTRRVEDIDPALVRPGRLDCLVKVGRPGMGDRVKILEHVLQGVEIGGDRGELVRRIAEKTEGMTGGDLKAVCREAVMLAMEEGEDVEVIGAEMFDFAATFVAKTRRPSLLQ